GSRRRRARSTGCSRRREWRAPIAGASRTGSWRSALHVLASHMGRGPLMIRRTGNQLTRAPIVKKAAVRSFVTSIQCRQSELPALRVRLGEWLEAVRIPPQTAFDVMLATHEAAKNAIAHADPTDSVNVRATI